MSILITSGLCTLVADKATQMASIPVARPCFCALPRPRLSPLAMFH